MKFIHEGEQHTVELRDDGTLDTVLVIDGEEVRLSPDFAAQYREEDGSFTDETLVHCAKDCIDAGCVGQGEL